MTDIQILENLLQTAHAVPFAELPSFIGQLAAANAIALSRLQSPTVQPQPIDELLDTEEAARRLGVSRHYLLPASCGFWFHPEAGKKAAVFQQRDCTVHQQQNVTYFKERK